MKKEQSLHVEVLDMQIKPSKVQDIHDFLSKAHAKGMNYVSFPKETFVQKNDLQTFPDATKAKGNKYSRQNTLTPYGFEPIGKMLKEIQRLPEMEKKRQNSRGYGQ